MRAVCCHPKQPHVVMGNKRGVLQVWDYNNKVIICIRVFEIETNIQCVTFDPQGETAVKSSQIYLCATFYTPGANSVCLK